MAQMRTSHTDPEVAAGLAAIAKLDEELREASLKVCTCVLLWDGGGGGRGGHTHTTVSLAYLDREPKGSQECMLTRCVAHLCCAGTGVSARVKPGAVG